MALPTGIILAVTSAALGTVGIIAGAEEQKNQAAIAKENARIQQAQIAYNQRAEEREAAAIEAENAENIRRQRLESERLKAAQRAMLGKSGAALASGSPLAILGETAAIEERSALDSHYAGYRQAAAHYARAAEYGVQGQIAAWNAKMAKRTKPSGLSTMLNITDTWVNAGTQIAGAYLTGGAAGSKSETLKVMKNA